MDYEKLYKDALERAKALSEGKVEAEKGTTVYECIFPELKKKSKDEEILDALIDFYGIGANNNEHTDGIPDKDILAWLEKQKKFYEEVNEKDFREFIANLAAQFPEVSFAKISRIAVRVKNYIDTQNKIKQSLKKDNDIF